MKRSVLLHLLPLSVTALQLVDADSLNNLTEYIFTVTHVADHPTVGFPSDAISDSLYLPVTQMVTYRITFTGLRDTVFIDTTRYGLKISEDSTSVHYNLISTSGVNGTFIIHENDSLSRADLTLYGSGVPIIKSERGVLEPVDVSIMQGRLLNRKQQLKNNPLIRKCFLLNGRIADGNYGKKRRNLNNFYLHH